VIKASSQHATALYNETIYCPLSGTVSVTSSGGSHKVGSRSSLQFDYNGKKFHRLLDLGERGLEKARA